MGTNKQSYASAKNCTGDNSSAQGNIKEWGHKQIFLANHLASTDNLTRTTKRQTTHTMKTNNT